MNNNLNDYVAFFDAMNTSSLSPGAALLLGLIAVWSLIWKGIALWKAARLASKPWFIALLLLNTAGILEIIYIFFVARKKEAKDEKNIS